MIYQKKTNRFRRIAKVLVPAGATWFPRNLLWDNRNCCLYWVDPSCDTIYKFVPWNTEIQQWKSITGIEEIVPLGPDEGRFLLRSPRCLVRWTEENHQIGEQFCLGKVVTDEEGNSSTDEAHIDSNLDAPLHVIYEQFPRERIIFDILKTDIFTVHTELGKIFYWQQSSREVRWIEITDVSKHRCNHHVLLKMSEESGIVVFMRIGPDNRLWTVNKRGLGVYAWDTVTGEQIQRIHVNTPNLLHCTFGGTSGYDLFISSTRSGMSTRKLIKFPNSGAIFHYRVTPI